MNNIKKVLILMFAIIFMFGFSCKKKEKNQNSDNGGGNQENPPIVNNLEISCDANINAEVGDEIDLHIAAKELGDKTLDDVLAGLTYSFTDESIIEVSGGKLKAVKAGQTVVTIKFGEATAQALIKVAEKVDPNKITTVTFNDVPTEIKVGETFTITYTCNVENVTAAYESSAPAKLSVTDNVIKGVAKGDVTLTVKITSLTDEYFKTFDIKVIKESNIKYNLDGGTLPEGAKTTYIEGQEYILPIPTKEGYNFVGWAKSKTSTSYITKIFASYTSAQNIYAIWEKIVVVSNIEYDLDGGSTSAILPLTYTEGEEEVILPKLSKTGYTFLGWSYEKGDTSYVTKISLTDKGDKKLYANFVEKQVTYDISYELNGGSWEWSSTTISDASKGIDAYSNLPEIFMQDFFNYLKEFNLLGSDKLCATTKGGHNIKAMRTWEEFSILNGDPYACYNDNSKTAYSVNDGFNQFFFDSLDNENPVGGFFGTSPYKEKYATLFNLIYNLTKVKYMDNGSNPGFMQPAIAFVLDGYFYGTQGLLASSKTNYLKFNALRAVVPTPFVMYTYEDKINNSSISYYPTTCIDGPVSLVSPVREGYVFAGWYDNEELLDDPVTTVEEGLVLYAKWVSIETPKYKINCNLFGGACSINEYYYEGIEYVLPIPTKKSNKFLGWSTEEASQSYITKIEAGTTGEITLYACWEEVDENSIYITYVYEDGNLPMVQAKTQAEFNEYVLKSFYEWLGETSDFNTWKTTVTTKWKTGSMGSYKFFKINGEDEIDESYFVHAKSNFDYWMNWMKAVDASVHAANSAQYAWTSEYAGYMRLGQILTETYPSTYSAQIKADLLASELIPLNLITSFKKDASATNLVELTIDDGRTFMGWYKDADFSGERITSTSQITEDCTLYAKWSEATHATEFTVTNKPTVMYKLDTLKLQYVFTPSNTTNKKLKFATSNANIIAVDEDGILTAKNTGNATITITVLDNPSLNVSFEVEVKVDPFIDVLFNTTSVVEPENTISVNSLVYGTTGNVLYKSSNTSIATVTEDGVITGVKEGYVEITAYLEGNESVKTTFGVTVIPYSESEFFKEIAKAHNPEVFVRRDLNVAYAYLADVYVSVSDLLFNRPYSVNTEFEAIQKANTSNRGKDGSLDKVEFVTVHYTAGTPASSNARNTASYMCGTDSVSIHYTTGNDGIYHCVANDTIAWHAGDGTGTAFKWTNTGVKATENVKPVWGVVKNSASSSGYYFTLNGQATTIVVPTTGTTSSGANKTMTDPSQCFTYFGPAWKVVDGYYYMGNTWACFTQTLAGAISSRGGNRNSIGIETACNKGSDLWLTYQITAQLVARLCDEFNLDLSRVVGHNAFSGKDCPQTLLANGGELWERFMECVTAEYNVYETMTKSGKYTITAISNNPDILSDNGRIISIPNYTTEVSYTVTVKNNETGETKTATFASIVHGVYTE